MCHPENPSARRGVSVRCNQATRSPQARTEGKKEDGKSKVEEGKEVGGGWRRGWWGCIRSVVQPRLP
jgi:hypothetical protein